MPSEAESSVLSAILVANELVATRLEPSFRKLGLNFGAFELLAAVRSGKGQISQAELSRRLGITPASLCEAVQLASNRGFVEQTQSKTDGRVKIVRLTYKGNRVLDQALAAFQALDDEVANALSRTRMAAGLSALQSIIEALDSEEEA